MLNSWEFNNFAYNNKLKGLDLIMIEEFKCSLWNKYDLCLAAHSDVNLIVGINGSGKTTLLNKLYQELCKKVDKSLVVYQPSIDNIAMRDKRKASTALAQDLDFYIYDMKSGPSLMFYRMAMLDVSDEQQQAMKARIEQLKDTINQFFSVSGKRIEIESNKFWILNDGEKLTIDSLSSGEKQLLLILLRVFLLEGKEAYVLIDEPENSLDIEWQYNLVNVLVELNPHAQYFITTHSPGIFGDGWGDKVIYMDQIVKVKE